MITVEIPQDADLNPQLDLGCHPNHPKGGSQEMLTRLWVRLSGYRRGQTMTEYALILAAVAIVVFITYQVMGQDIGKLVNKVDSALTTT
jgi:Flp pilus assembly pilin Flp